MMITCMNSPIVVDVPGLKDCIRKERSTTISVWESGAFFWIWTYPRIQCIRSALVPWNISPVGVVKDGGWLLLSLETSNSSIFFTIFQSMENQDTLILFFFCSCKFRFMWIFATFALRCHDWNIISVDGCHEWKLILHSSWSACHKIQNLTTSNTIHRSDSVNHSVWIYIIMSKIYKFSTLFCIETSTIFKGINQGCDIFL